MYISQRDAKSKFMPMFIPDVHWNAGRVNYLCVMVQLSSPLQSPEVHPTADFGWGFARFFGGS